MVWEFNSHSIVQLCNLEENGEEVCKKYWPPNEGAKVQYGGYKVTLQIEKISRDFVVRKLHITPNVSHYAIMFNVMLLYFLRVEGKAEL